MRLVCHDEAGARGPRPVWRRRAHLSTPVSLWVRPGGSESPMPHDHKGLEPP